MPEAPGTTLVHIQRLRLDVPLRATGDADFGVPPHVLRRPDLVSAIEAAGYRKVIGNRWERTIDRRVAPTRRPHERNPQADGQQRATRHHQPS